MQLNRDKLNNIGFNFDNDRDAILYMSSLVEYLTTHNKNYTQAQYNRILTIADILDCFDEVYTSCNQSSNPPQ